MTRAIIIWALLWLFTGLIVMATVVDDAKAHTLPPWKCKYLMWTRAENGERFKWKIGCERYSRDHNAAHRLPSFFRGAASSYRLFGFRTACGQTVTSTSRWVAHRWWPCGTRVQVCNSGRCAVLPVKDRGPYSGSRVLDITEGATRAYWGASAYGWGVRTVAYRRLP